MKRGARQSPTVVIAISQNNGRGLPRLVSPNVIAGWGCLLPDGALFLPPSVLPINREKACFEVFQSIVLVYGYWVFIAFFTPFPEGRSCKCKSPY